MTALPRPQAWTALASLRRFADAASPSPPSERCDICGAGLGAAHSHVANIVSRTLLCACRPCYLLFTHDGSGGSRFRAVPERCALVTGEDGAPPPWAALEIPTGLAFFFRSSATGRLAGFYPSPAGATESELPLDAWDDLVEGLPVIGTLQPDVEALLVRSASASDSTAAESDRMTAFIVPIDVCYELAGVIRRGWRGFQGGDDVWREIDALFARLRERAAPVGGLRT
jgi:hypothetical protein